MGCNHDCASCSSDCSGKESLKEELNQLSTVKKVIGVVSGKGGVGKSLVTSLMAVTYNRRGAKTAILDADITGPSIPKAFGIYDKAMGTEAGILPAVTETGIELMSINLLLKEETDPVDLAHLLLVVKDLTSRRKIGSLDDFVKVGVGVTHQGDGRVAGLN